MTNENVLEPTRIWSLNANDRCDACQARAYFRVTLPSFGQLLFCIHHGREYEPKLKPTAVDWVDESAARDEQ